jgi:hypothetical protein
MRFTWRHAVTLRWKQLPAHSFGALLHIRTKDRRQYLVP